MEAFEYRGNQIEWFCFPETGIGKSRNNALLRASKEICLFADDDVIYCDNYSDVIEKEFAKHTDADLIIFNVISMNPKRQGYQIRRHQRIHFYNCLRYGTFRIAIRREAIQKERLFFSLLFGGGSHYGSGEDSLFLMDCIKRGLHIYASPEVIGTVSHTHSTWFSGYTDKYFFDKGALFCSMSNRFSKLLCLQFCLRHMDMMNTITCKKAYQYMLAGIQDYRKRT